MGPSPNRRDFLRIGGSAIAIAALTRCNDGLNRGQFAVGDASSFEVGTVTYFDEGPFFVLRDDEGLYAMSAVCTHNGCILDEGATELTCPCHGSVFDLEGGVTTGPASQDLEHLLLTVDGEGGVVVDTAQTVAASSRVAVS